MQSCSVVEFGTQILLHNDLPLAIEIDCINRKEIVIQNENATNLFMIDAQQLLYGPFGAVELSPTVSDTEGGLTP